MTRRLLLLRHGRAESPPTVADLDRPLSNKGRGQALLAGDATRELGLTPDRVVISPARRTRETWDAYLIGLGGAESGMVAPDELVEVDNRVYDNTLDDLLEVLRETGSDCGTALLIGHNPAVAGLAAVLDEEGSGPSHRRLAEGFPAGALAVLGFEGEWSDLRAGIADLEDLRVPHP